MGRIQRQYYQNFSMSQWSACLATVLPWTSGPVKKYLLIILSPHHKNQWLEPVKGTSQMQCFMILNYLYGSSLYYIVLLVYETQLRVRINVHELIASPHEEAYIRWREHEEALNDYHSHLTDFTVAFTMRKTWLDRRIFQDNITEIDTLHMKLRNVKVRNIQEGLFIKSQDIRNVKAGAEKEPEHWADMRSSVQ